MRRILTIRLCSRTHRACIAIKAVKQEDRIVIEVNLCKYSFLHYSATRLTKLALLFIQSGVKPKQILTRSLMFSRPFRQLHVIPSSFDWSTIFSVLFVIG